MDAYGAFCRVAFYSTLALGAFNNVTVELSTPHLTDPDGYLLCFTHPTITISPDSFSVSYVEEGGDQFSNGTIYPPDSFLLSSFSQHRPIEYGVAADVLGTDPFYAESYFRSRFDDFIVDGAGNNLTGVIQNPRPGLDTRETAASIAAQIVRMGGESSATAQLRAQLRELGRRYGNCALLTGEWKAGTRYSVGITVRNPSPTNATGPRGAMGLWAAPVTYRSLGRLRVVYSVRGGKYGAVCAPRAGVATTLFDACAEAVQRSLPGVPAVAAASAEAGTATTSATAGNAAVCVGLLQTAGATVAGGVVPLAQQMNASAQAPAACPAGTVRSWRFGECVECASFSGAAGRGAGACACPAGTRPLAVGPRACGPAFTAAGAVTLKGLADELCGRFTAARGDLMGGRLGDGLVANAYVSAFKSAGAPLVDWTTVFLANISYRASQMFDERRPNDPSRRRGLGPNCQQCLAIEAPAPSYAYGIYRVVDPPVMDPFNSVRGTFVDVNGKGESRVRDVHFDAVHALRFVGYLLRQAGFPCAPLFDPKNATAGIYGYYLSSRTAICGGFSKEKAKGYY